MLTDQCYSSFLADRGDDMQRPWQATYRNKIIRIWRVCAVTGCQDRSMLTASHIKPVIYCTPEEKVDPYNGLLLSKTYDALFDKGLISFQDDGRVVISTAIYRADLEALNFDFDACIRLDPRQLPYLNFHREKIFDFDLKAVVAQLAMRNVANYEVPHFNRTVADYEVPHFNLK